MIDFTLPQETFFTIPTHKHHKHHIQSFDSFVMLHKSIILITSYIFFVLYHSALAQKFSLLDFGKKYQYQNFFELTRSLLTKTKSCIDINYKVLLRWQSVLFFNLWLQALHQTALLKVSKVSKPHAFPKPIFITMERSLQYSEIKDQMF